jgi:broad specificity phosphatase PhoE
MSFIQTLRQDFPGKEVCVVGHGHTFLLFKKIVEGFDSKAVLEQYPHGIQANASVTIYRSKRSEKMRAVIERLAKAFGGNIVEAETILALGGDTLFLYAENLVTK